MIISSDWTLFYLAECGGNADIYSPALLARATAIKARVPGCYELDLFREEKESDPFFGLNHYEYTKYEHYQFIYQTTFSYHGEIPEEEKILLFDGLDTIADIYLNDTHVGSADNMLISHEYDVSDILRMGDNTLTVHIHSAMNYARRQPCSVFQWGDDHRSEIGFIRKAPHMFGWDILPRLVSAGIYRPVTLFGRNKTRITETYYSCCDYNETTDIITLTLALRFVTDHDTLDGFSVQVHGTCGDASFSIEKKLLFNCYNGTFDIPHPKLWWPKNYGDANLYDVTTQLLYNGEVVDVKKERIGLRTLILRRDFTLGKQDFCFTVNGKDIFVMGSNWVPQSAFHALDAERTDEAVRMVSDVGCNMLRLWGGNVYESDRFFDLCDENGILLWQDFAMGNTNYPQDDAFAARITEECTSLIKRIRNHPSLAIYNSDNEIRYKNTWHKYPYDRSNYDRLSHEVIPAAVAAHDPYRMSLASSPEIPDGFHLYNVPEQHIWGVRRWYKDPFYKDASAVFIGEIGYHGCPSAKTIRSFIPEEKASLAYVTSAEWAAHSTEDIRALNPGEWAGRNRMMRDHVHILFDTVPDALDEFVFLSQISQAEAFKFFIERSRAAHAEGKRTGILWWNLIDGWPQISDAVVDYFKRKKIAYYYIRRASSARLIFAGELSGLYHPLYASNTTSTDTVLTDVCVTDVTGGEILYRGDVRAPAGKTVHFADFHKDVSDKHLILMTWKENGVTHANHYLTGMPPYDAKIMHQWFDVIRTAGSDTFSFDEK